MAEKRRQYNAEFSEGAVQIVRETREPVAAVARDLGINVGTLANWVNKDKIERAEPAGLRKENAKLRMERDALK